MAIPSFPLALMRAGVPIVVLYGVRDDGSCRCWRNQCESPGKHPVSGEWTTGGTLDPLVLDGDMANEGYRCNFGALTGRKLADGRYLLVWDVDTDRGKPGMETMTRLRDEGKRIPPTLVIRTGGGGGHFYLATSEPMPSPGGPPGVDIQGTGRQVVIPPSRSGKGEYVIVRTARIADAPEWMVLDIKERHARHIERVYADLDVGPIIPPEKATHTREQVANAVRKDTGDRSEDTARIAFACARAGMTFDDFSKAINKRADLIERIESRRDDDLAAVWNYVRRTLDG